MYNLIKFDIFFLTVDFGGSFYRAKTRLQTTREMQQTNKVPLEGTNNSNAPLSSSYTNPDYVMHQNHAFSNTVKNKLCSGISKEVA